MLMVNLLSLNQLLAVLTSLQISSIALGPKLYREVSSANNAIRLTGIQSGKSLMYSKKRKGPRIDPYGTPVVTVDDEEFLP